MTLTAIDALEQIERTGIAIEETGTAIRWTGPKGGNIKPHGPLAGKRIAVILASEFSDFQVYYLASYIGEMGGRIDFLLVDWVTWKSTRPNVKDKGVRGMWDLSVDPIPVIGGDKTQDWRCLRDAKVDDYDAVIVPGGHSADVMMTEPEVTGFLSSAMEKGQVVGAIGAGSMPLIRAGLMSGRRCTGDATVRFMLERIATFEDAAVVVDDRLITARATIDIAAFFRALCAAFDPDFVDHWAGALAGKKVLIPVSDDFEDIELIAPTLELLHRGASVTIGHFKADLQARPALPGVPVLHGNFGTTIPFQEIPEDRYGFLPLSDIPIEDFDVAVITGAFNPWNMVMAGHHTWLSDANKAGKGLAAICHGPIPLAQADVVAGKWLTGWEASRDPVEIMGGRFECDADAAVIDGNIITGRTPAEVPEFVDAVSVYLLRQ